MAEAACLHRLCLLEQMVRAKSSLCNVKTSLFFWPSDEDTFLCVTLTRSVPRFANSFGGAVGESEGTRLKRVNNATRLSSA